MNRFHIEEIVEQDKHGVVFRARDEKSGDIVSLRRFLPFGRDGGGLEKEEAKAFEIASHRLAEVSHVALRSVITGSVDPIDGIPYLVTEWVEGSHLDEILDGEKLDPALVIEILRIALEVSIVLSHVLGEEAVWVETEVESIVIGTAESGRGFTFWISPFKWLGAQFESRKLSAIVDLGEELMGWKRKLVSDQAGYGLGGWLKWLKKNPDAHLAEALEKLAASTGKNPPPPKAELIKRTTNSLALRSAQQSSKTLLLLTAAVTLLVISVSLLYLYKTSKPPKIAAQYSERQISPVLKEGEIPTEDTTEREPAAGPSPTPSEKASALAKEMSLKSAVPVLSATAPAQKTARHSRIYAPADKPLWDAIKAGTPVKLSGTLRAVTKSGTGKSVYLNFSDPPDSSQLAGVIHIQDVEGIIPLKAFNDLIGKKILITGTCHKEPRGRVLAKFKHRQDIKTLN